MTDVDDFDLVPTGDATDERNAFRLRERFAELPRSTVITVEFTAAGQQRVAHRLARAPDGWTFLCRLGNVQVWDFEEPDDDYLYLEADGAVTARIEIRAGVA